ncbi:hypothetical protein KFE25_010066 [Diacronema lutheri]|uniref:Uncharacterized protein n=1 Tax=Diacronema lutheri TaxID=2081491 RepID=A0A8J5XI03_DIALT|nr:hypothetical protein KFE25_010066 [Diacronema lutheri]
MAVLLAGTIPLLLALSRHPITRQSEASAHTVSRRSALSTFGAFGVSIFAVTGAPVAVRAAADSQKSRGLSEPQLKARLLADIVDARFMVTGKLSQDLYADTAKFTDEIDTYDMPNFIKGTGLLFDGERSEFKLIGDLEFADEGRTVRYRFDEILSFRIPLQPRSRVSGRVELKRGDDGLIQSYREFWDQSVPETLLNVVLDGFGVKRAAFT